MMNIVNSEMSYKAYRTSLKSAVPPLLPWLGLALSDITFIEVGNSDEIDSKINFHKRELVSSTNDNNCLPVLCIQVHTGNITTSK
jgi:hypothetical protein